MTIKLDKDGKTIRSVFTQLSESQNKLNKKWELFLENENEIHLSSKLNESDDSLEDARRRYEKLVENKKTSGISQDLVDVFKDENQPGLLGK